MDEIRDLLRQVRQTEQGLLEARQRESEREVGRIRLAFFFSIAINASLLVAAFVTVLRDAARRRDTAEALLSRKQELERLVEARTAELSALAAHVEKVQEEEKASFARELHDDFGSALTVIKMDLASIRKKMSADPLVEKKLEKTSAVVDSCVETQRRLIQKLRPTILDDLGIGAALRWQANEFAMRTNIACDVQLYDLDAKLNEELSIAFFRITQEALTNVVRHAEACRVQISLANADAGLVLTISDNGVGIGQRRPQSHGLTGMRERARRLRGTFTISPSPGGGTTVEVRFRIRSG